MLRYLTVSICLLLALSCKVAKESNKQESKESIETSGFPQSVETKSNFDFPDDWLGFWTGDLNIYNNIGLKQSLPMSLDNSITGTKGQYTWAIIYGTDSISGRRDYLLKEIDRNTGYYVVDERNGILLDAYVIDNELVSVFEVMGNTLISTYKREGDKMLFEIMMYKSKYTGVTGDTIIATDTIPAVKNYKPFVRQKAILKKRI